MKFQAPYELQIADVEVTASSDGTRNAVITFKGRQGTQTAQQPIKSDAFSDLFDCCRLLAKDILAKEFRLNSAVDLDFELTGEDGITVLHKKPSTFLKMPMNMSMKWSCLHMQKNYNSFTSLGLVEMPSEFTLTNGALSAKETLQLMLHSMESGIEFMGMLIQKRDQIDHDKEVKDAGG